MLTNWPILMFPQFDISGEYCQFSCMSSISYTQTDVEEQFEDGDALLKCFSPLLNSMKLFGLYFTRAERHVHDASRSTSTTVTTRIVKGGHTYGMVIMVVLWLNVVRMFSVFDKADKFGVAVLLKLAMVSGSLLSAVLQTACFVASHTGNLDCVFRDARLPKSDHIRYRRLAIIHTVVCWIRIVAEELVFLVPLLLAEEHWDLSMTPFGVHIDMTGQQILLIKLFAALLYLFLYAAWTFPYSVNYTDNSKVLQCTGRRAVSEPIHSVKFCGGLNMHGCM